MLESAGVRYSHWDEHWSRGNENYIQGSSAGCPHPKMKIKPAEKIRVLKIIHLLANS